MHLNRLWPHVPHVGLLSSRTTGTRLRAPSFGQATIWTAPGVAPVSAVMPDVSPQGRGWVDWRWSWGGSGRVQKNGDRTVEVQRFVPLSRGREVKRPQDTG